MLFNSHIFIFVFLPITLILFFLGRRYLTLHYANLILVLASLFFYGWWAPRYIPLIVGSIFGNYLFGLWLSKSKAPWTNVILGVGIALNLLLLGSFKYTGFITENLNLVAGSDLYVPQIVLPIGISFYTFQQIAFLVDAAAHRVKERSFVEYALFVSFFPQLIAGPIVHHKEMMPQFAREKGGSRRFALANVGVTLFVIGLAKKVLVADTAALFSTPVFDAALDGRTPSFLEAWGGALAYTFQIYFDFSGYSDMAAGLALMFGIRLPINFFSPYKATSVIDFWRRWHITLSRFLRDHLYVPLGGNRGGEPRRFYNVFLTMLLGGIWHGAAWTFVIWGALHGVLICINHLWHKIAHVHFQWSWLSSTYWRVASLVATFFVVVVAWTFFRAESIGSALLILSSMFGANGIGILPPLQPVAGAGHIPCSSFQLCGAAFPNGLASWEFGWPLLILLLLVVWFVPNSYEMLRRYRPMLLILDNRVDNSDKRGIWRPGWLWAILVGITFAACVVVMTGESEFLYFQF